jgi:hypothetical protein
MALPFALGLLGLWGGLNAAVPRARAGASGDPNETVRMFNPQLFDALGDNPDKRAALGEQAQRQLRAFASDGREARAGVQGLLDGELAGINAQRQAEQWGSALSGYEGAGLLAPHQVEMFRNNPELGEHFFKQHYTRQALSPGALGVFGDRETRNPGVTEQEFNLAKEGGFGGNYEQWLVRQKDISNRQPQAQILRGSQIHPDLPDDTLFMRKADGTVSPLNVAPESATEIMQGLNNYTSQSRTNAEKLRAYQVGKATLAQISQGNLSDFDAIQAVQSWMQSIGATVRSGQEGGYVVESGLGNEINRLLSQVLSRGQMTPAQVQALERAMDLSARPVIERQTMLDNAHRDLMVLIDPRGGGQRFENARGSVWGAGAEEGPVNYFDQYGLTPR